jgi:ArsR family transcriptional regulator
MIRGRWTPTILAAHWDPIMAKKKTLSEHQIHLIAKALADPRRHEILQQIGASKDTASCTDIRGCQPVTAATLSDQFK